MSVPAGILAALPSPCEACIETHISWVLLAGEFAWKVKKPVTLPFLDYGSREKRRACCAEELRLNRRFAPALYLEVVELAGEPAVKMRRFADSCRLDQLLRRGELTAGPLTRFARELVAFQADAERAPPASPYGAPQTVLSAAQENFTELAALRADQAPRLAALQAWTQAEGARRAADFARRQEQGFVREGHGDLHLANLVMLDGRIVPFDGIEFNPALRIIDVANEIAFTLLDLLDHGAAGLAARLLDAWLESSGDFAALAVLRFYLVYRALVRAKVAALQGRPAECDGYLALAERLIAPPAPTLTITHGVSGSGKTFCATRRLASADFLDTVRVRSDVERKRLFGLAPEAKSGGTIYGPAATAATYARLGEIAALALSHGYSVIVDAAFLKRAERDTFRALAARLGVPFAILAPTAPRAELERRLAARSGDASEADATILARQLEWLEALGADEPAVPA
ncbi:MAG: AAA family ATPase, partial [Rhodocyclaceae bacterium]|nr:AAA family ATPase [Rhodocyclaceae bacterium]